MLQGTLQERLLGIVCYISIIGWVELANPSSMAWWGWGSCLTGNLRGAAENSTEIKAIAGGWAG